MVEPISTAKREFAKQRFDDELTFRIRSRRNRLLGLWAAANLGLSGEAADAYAKRVVAMGIEKSGDKDLAKWIHDTSIVSGAALPEQSVREEMDRLSRIAALEFAATEVPSRPRAA